MRAARDQQQSRVIYDLCCLLLDVLRCSPSMAVPFSALPSVASSNRTSTTSPAAFASLLLGISLALMLCGSVTFVIGFILMPWILGTVMVFYLVSVVSNLYGRGRAVLWPSPGKEMMTGNDPNNYLAGDWSF